MCSKIKTVNVGGYKIDFRKEVIEANTQEKSVSLTPTESCLLQKMVANKGETVPIEEFYSDVFKEEYTYEDRRLHSHVSHLRQKLQKAGLPKSWVQNEWGVGYSFSQSS